MILKTKDSRIWHMFFLILRRHARYSRSNRIYSDDEDLFHKNISIFSQNVNIDQELKNHDNFQPKEDIISWLCIIILPEIIIWRYGKSF